MNYFVKSFRNVKTKEPSLMFLARSSRLGRLKLAPRFA